MGDIHGDLVKAITLFKLAGVVEEVDRRLLWIGGDTTVVQLGDVLDRGSQEIGAHRRLIQHEPHRMRPLALHRGLLDMPPMPSFTCQQLTHRHQTATLGRTYWWSSSEWLDVYVQPLCSF